MVACKSFDIKFSLSEEQVWHTFLRIKSSIVSFGTGISVVETEDICCHKIHVAVAKHDVFWTHCIYVDVKWVWFAGECQGSDTRVRTKKKPGGGFFGVHPPKKTTSKNPHFYFNLILVHTLYATNIPIFYCF